ncbi:hypothetical protein C8A05DRAFT_33735 [Staphylotrichum tortipilum]|uniref:Uncharacterized protein n=1 Tax=Staphylotrichum tortipilum TaxID=2831512 RepID=A0AAN6MKI2_9PEZI|nr:hypothetical protein C8A05DRAFT_33735 [Staphylotrichum longicolle]
MSTRSRSPSSSSRSSGGYREVRLPNTLPVSALIYFCGRDPRKAKSIRRYYDDDIETRSTASGGSIFSWSSEPSSVCLVESTNPYWDYYADQDSYSYSSGGGGRKRSKSSSKRGRSSRASSRRSGAPPTSSWGRRATVEDDDDSSDDGSVDYDDHGPGPFPHPVMMPGPPGPPPGPPPGAFQQVYGAVPQYVSPHPTPVNGYGGRPPPQQMAAGMAPPAQGGGGGHFVTGRGGIQVFMND